ncbi:hypothetical protein LTR28_005089 [Elasticomyces elasticus]|nr:hypothetical protein LTR28_005089 [Elasticomyces elasticus]
MGLRSTGSAFADDVLRIQISGPSQPHLTIVDLPGLIHSENKFQTLADVKLVQDMVQRQISNRRSIILAVISAQNDFANQVVLKLAREVDESSVRTLGVITKPDTLPSFQSLTKAARDGVYSDSSFEDPRSPEGYSRRLRAVVQNCNVEFAETVRLRSHRHEIVEKIEHDADQESRTRLITRTEFLDYVHGLLKRGRGRELLGMFNPLVVGDLFHDQSQYWKSLAEDYVRVTWQATRAFLDIAVSYLAEEATSEAILVNVVEPAMEERLGRMKIKLPELLTPFYKVAMKQ